MRVPRSFRATKPISSETGCRNPFDLWVEDGWWAWWVYPYPPFPWWRKKEAWANPILCCMYDGTNGCMTQTIKEVMSGTMNVANSLCTDEIWERNWPRRRDRTFFINWCTVTSKAVPNKPIPKTNGQRTMVSNWPRPLNGPPTGICYWIASPWITNDKWRTCHGAEPWPWEWDGLNKDPPASID